MIHKTPISFSTIPHVLYPAFTKNRVRALSLRPAGPRPRRNRCKAEEGGFWCTKPCGEERGMVFVWLLITDTVTLESRGSFFCPVAVAVPVSCWVWVYPYGNR